LSPKGNNDKERSLESILGRFDRENKEVLALELVISLDLEQDGRPYQLQVAALLKRKLTRNEEFRLRVLNNALTSSVEVAAWK
jgi:hypothetical protein